MQQRQLFVGVAVGFALALAGCQTGPIQPSGAAPAATQPAVVAGSDPTSLTGTITYALDSSNGSGGSTTEMHQHLTVNVHLVADPQHPFTFKDSGSTFTYAGSSKSNDPQTASSCGMHQESTDTGAGAFAPKGSISAMYSDNSPEASLSIHAPYSSTGSTTFLCNGQTSSGTTDELSQSDCSEGGTGALVGTILPGNVTKIVRGQTIDFACSVTLPIGTGSITVTGTLTSQ